MGFEPTASTLTGWRALQAAPRGQCSFAVAQVGVEPTASSGLSQGGLPIAYRAVQYPEQESNLQTPDPKSGRSPLAYLGVSSPGWTRTTDRLLVRKPPLPLGHRTALAEAEGLEPPSRSRDRLFSRQRPHPAG